MSKITFRADEDLVERVERLDASKSEVMREALREYLERNEPAEPDTVDLAGGLGDALDEVPARDVNVNVTIRTQAEETVETDGQTERGTRRPPAESRERSCPQCGEDLSDDHVYCPNCGEKATRRLFCECGDELRSDWSHCPSCGRRTPSADVLER